MNSISISVEILQANVEWLLAGADGQKKNENVSEMQKALEPLEQHREAMEIFEKEKKEEQEVTDKARVR